MGDNNESSSTISLGMEGMIKNRMNRIPIIMKIEEKFKSSWSDFMERLAITDCFMDKHDKL